MQAVLIRDRLTRTPTDRELAAALARGEADAVDAFYDAHLDDVYRFVFFRLGRVREDAEDVTAETFMTALERAGSFEGRSSLGAWLRGIARNKCRERRKRIARSRSRGEASLDPARLESLACLDSRGLPDQVVASAETAAAVAATLAQIPSHYRAVLLSKYVDGMTCAEIASERGSSEKAVESTVHRAKLAFARILRVVTGASRAEAFHD